MGIRLADPGTLDALYIDAMTKAGMSGSPVLYLGKTGDLMYADDGGVVQKPDDDPYILGVYAGRDGVTNEEYEISLGRVWKVGLVERLFMQNVSAFGISDGDL